MKPSFVCFFGSVLALASLAACKESERSGRGKEKSPLKLVAAAPDSTQVVNDLAFLTSRECEGRRPGTKGHQLALDYILQRMRSTGLDSLEGSLIQNFTGRSLNGYTEGRNVVGWIKGKKIPDKYIVLTAHYDHLGLAKDSDWFAGADDNASGTSAALGIASVIKQSRPDHSVIIALLDREESGLEGGHALVENLTKLLGATSIIFNINLDMVARSDKNELYVCGTRYHPELAEVVNKVQAQTSVKLPMGHDGGSGSPSDDWTKQSDHYAFHKAGIPFLYLGVEDHPDYHRTSDKFEKVNLSNFYQNCKAIWLLLREVDETGLKL